MRNLGENVQRIFLVNFLLLSRVYKNYTDDIHYILEVLVGGVGSHEVKIYGSKMSIESS